MHTKTGTRAVAAFLCKASPVPQPCQTAIKAKRHEWGLGTSNGAESVICKELALVLTQSERWDPHAELFPRTQAEGVEEKQDLPCSVGGLSSILSTLPGGCF